MVWLWMVHRFWMRDNWLGQMDNWLGQMYGLHRLDRRREQLLGLRVVVDRCGLGVVVHWRRRGVVLDGQRVGQGCGRRGPRLVGAGGHRRVGHWSMGQRGRVVQRVGGGVWLVDWRQSLGQHLWVGGGVGCHRQQFGQHFGSHVWVVGLLKTHETCHC